jgi:hypothetical protein
MGSFDSYGYPKNKYLEITDARCKWNNETEKYEFKE